MTQPPSSPPSSDIAGVSRDRDKSVARGKRALPGQQEQLAGAHEQNAARPSYDDDIAAQENAR